MTLTLVVATKYFQHEEVRDGIGNCGGRGWDVYSLHAAFRCTFFLCNPSPFCVLRDVLPLYIYPRPSRPSKHEFLTVMRMISLDWESLDAALRAPMLQWCSV